MAEEKKPDLKSRLKKTAAPAPAPAGPPAAGGVAGPPVMPPVSASVPAPPVASPGPVPAPGEPFVAPPIGAPPIAAPAIPGIAPAVPGIPGFGPSVAPPAFVEEERRRREEAERAAAAAARMREAAADPLGGGGMVAAPVGPQEVRLVLDDKPVDDKEVGRKRTGTVVALVATGIIALGVGYLLGNTLEQKKQERLTLTALTEVTRASREAGNLIGAIKTRVETAAERGNITLQREGGGEGQPAAPTHPPQADEDLIRWYQEQLANNVELPLQPGIYAGRVGRLRPDTLGKLTVVQLQLNELWSDLREHTQRTNIANVRNALTAATGDLSRMVVIFGTDQQGILATVATAAAAPNAQGQITLVPGAGIQANATRTILLQPQGPNIPVASLAQAAIRVNPQEGIGAEARRSAGRAWIEYRERLQGILALVTELNDNHQRLMQELDRAPRR